MPELLSFLMRRLLPLALLAGSLSARAQSPACSLVHSTVDVAASYQYGDASLINFKNDALAPLLVGCAGPEFGKIGSLYLLLTIDSTGQVREVTIAQGLLSDACKTLLRNRILAMQGWKPARLAGQPVCSRFRWAVGSLGSSVQGLGSLKGVDTLPHMRMTGPVEIPKPVDSNITIRPFDLNPFAVVLPPAEKKKRVAKAMKQAFGESSVLFLKDPCLTLDSVTGAQRPLKGKAPDCRLKDFYFLDLDKDGDLDLIYSSVTDQYLNWGSNRLFIFRNDGAVYSTSSIAGYLYEADFSKWEQHSILLKTAQRPAAPGGRYQFLEHHLHTDDWHLLQGATFERRAGLVHEQ